MKLIRCEIQNFGKIIQPAETFDKTCPADFTESSTEDLKDRKHNKNCHKKDAWQKPYIRFYQSQ